MVFQLVPRDVSLFRFMMVWYGGGDQDRFREEECGMVTIFPGSITSSAKISAIATSGRCNLLIRQQFRPRARVKIKLRNETENKLVDTMTVEKESDSKNEVWIVFMVNSVDIEDNEACIVGIFNQKNALEKCQMFPVKK